MVFFENYILFYLRHLYYLQIAYRPHLDYGDVVYDQPSNDALSSKLQTVQYIPALAITGAIKGTSCKKLYQELGLEYLQQRRWMRYLCLFYKVVSTKLPAKLTSTKLTSMILFLQSDNLTDMHT